MRPMFLRRLPLVGAVVLLAALAALLPDRAAAATPTTQTYFVCPTVSVQNPNGMWVIGQHGGYYMHVPIQGSTGSKVYLTIPVQVFSLAEVPAGWGLYSSLPSYPNFVGTATLLQEGIDRWLNDPPGWQEGDMAMVMDNGNGTYTVHDLTINASATTDQPIPLASAAVW